MKTKAISLWQPYATLIAIEAKHCETRSWGTNYRGLVAIHAAKSNDSLHMISQPYFKSALASQNWHHINDIPRGVVVAVADLVDCFKMTPAIIAQQSAQERAFGDWTPGRYGWLFVNVRKFDKPIVLRGAQGLFDCEIDL